MVAVERFVKIQTCWSKRVLRGRDRAFISKYNALPRGIPPSLIVLVNSSRIAKRLAFIER